MKTLRNVTLKALVILIALNLLFAAVPLDVLGRVSAYNHLFPGRWRLPWSENPAKAYSLSLNNLNAMFASHEVRAAPAPNEFRVFILGDSSVWGFLLPKEDTLAAQLNAANLTSADGRRVRAYNLGYPTISLTKDLLLLDQSLRFSPDLVVWFVTLDSFPADKQLFTPLVQHNPEPMQRLISTYQLNLNPSDPSLISPTFLNSTLLGQRRAVADLLRLQLYGVLWSATGVDQDIPAAYPLLTIDYEADISYYDYTLEEFSADTLAFDVLAAGVERAGDVPVLIVNEPIFISSGQNSDLRYNLLYPRWAYDAYRQMLTKMAAEQGWTLLDLWNAVPPEDFTNTAIHYNVNGVADVVQLLEPVILEMSR
jgi:hypothetical protein